MKEDKHILQQIHSEVKGTAALVPIFKYDPILKIIERTTYICYRRLYFNEYPNTLTELAIPLLYALLTEFGDLNSDKDIEKLDIDKLEADLFSLMHRICHCGADKYFSNPSQELKFFESTLKKINPQLHEYLVSKEVSFDTFAPPILYSLHFKKIRKVPIISYIWDKYMVVLNSFSKFHAIFCAHIISYLSEEIHPITETSLIYNYVENIDISDWNYKDARNTLKEVCSTAEELGLYNPNLETEFSNLVIIDVVQHFQNIRNDTNQQ